MKRWWAVLFALALPALASAQVNVTPAPDAASGVLPDGISLGSSGSISSTPTQRIGLITTGGSGIAFQLTTGPTCSSNCGTSPSVSGSDSSMTVTMGASGVPTSGWVIAFGGTWAAAPQCMVMPALTGMAVGKTAIVVATTTTTITVTTNGTAPSTSDKYHIKCSLGL